YVESPLRCVSGITGSDLKNRIHVILTGRIAGDLCRSKVAVLLLTIAAAISAPILVGVAQSIPKETFEVASIKIGVAAEPPEGTRGGPQPPCAGRIQIQANRFLAASTNIYPLIASAYDKGDC